MIWTDPSLQHLQLAWVMFGPVRAINFLFAHDKRCFTSLPLLDEVSESNGEKK